MQKNGKNLNCAACGKSFYVPQCRLHNAKFCSRDCSLYKKNEGKKRYFICKGCGEKKETVLSRIRKKYCSRECLEKRKVTKSQERLKWATTRRILRASGKDRPTTKCLKRMIFSIREKKCELCGFCECETALEVHHIDRNPFNNLPENIQIACCNCHRRIHKGNLKHLLNLESEEEKK